MPHNYTINFKREKQVKMKTTRYEKLHVTLMLCTTANGNKLPSYVILNRKMVPKEHFCKDVTVWAQKKKNKNKKWMTGLDVYENVGLVYYQSHGVCLQWMHFMAISPKESEIG
jgi:hypothetical protein